MMIQEYQGGKFQPVHIPKPLREKVVRMVDSGYSVRRIALYTGIPKSTVHDWIRRWLY